MSLKGLRIVVTRPRRQSGALVGALEAAGARVISLPTIAIADPPSWGELDAALGRLQSGAYRWVLFTSANSVDKVLGRLDALGLGAVALRRARVGAVGRVTAGLLEERGVSVAVMPDVFVGEALAAALDGAPGRVLLPRALGAPDALVAALEAKAWEVDEVPAYEAAAVAQEGPEARGIRAGDFDVVTFASGSAARAFALEVARPDEVGLGPVARPHEVGLGPVARPHEVGLGPVARPQEAGLGPVAPTHEVGEGREAGSDKLVVCIGPKTAEAAGTAGFRVDVVATEHTDEGLVRALEDARRIGP